MIVRWFDRRTKFQQKLSQLEMRLPQLINSLKMQTNEHTIELGVTSDNKAKKPNIKIALY